jgi:ribose transport system permease protein
VVLFLIFAITQSPFLSTTNLKNMLTNSAVLWIVAIGMTFVILGGGFDLSVGATATLCGIVMAKLTGTAGVPGGIALAVTIVAGAGAGVFNGVLVGRFGMSVFVVTLASMTALTGVIDLWSHANSFFVSAPIVQTLTATTIVGCPVPIWIMAISLVVGRYVLTRSYFGRDVYAVGGSPVAARLSGVRVTLTLVGVFALVGACASLAGVITIGEVGAATPTVDPTLPLQAIAAVLLGGTALTGGSGDVIGTALGVLFIAILQNGLGLAGISNNWQDVVTGVILIVAVGGNKFDLRALMRRRASRGLIRGSIAPADLSPEDVVES